MESSDTSKLEQILSFTNISDTLSQKSLNSN